MELTLWTYEGPPHVGAMRIANSMPGVHFVLHAPQGDTYADLLFTMIERRDRRPSVTYTTFQARDLGGDTAELVRRTLAAAVDRFAPDLLLVGESCTAELIQDQPGTLAAGMDLACPIVPLSLPSYSKKEDWGASETFYAIVRSVLGQARAAGTVRGPGSHGGSRPRANLLGPTSMGFRCRDDVEEVRRLLERAGVDVHVVAPLGARIEDIARLPEADVNLCLNPEIAETTARFLEREFGQPIISTVPIGIGATRDLLLDLQRVLGIDVSEALALTGARLPWYSRSVDSTYLTGKRVFVFGDATHAIAAARVAREELGFEVVGLGTYSRGFARNVREAARKLGLEALITDDYLEVERRVAELAPDLVLGTQMERHVAKRLGIPCAVISAPVHVQDFPARYSPQMGIEGANVLFDTWVHPLMMGLEEHLLGMFRDDFEFHEGARPSHLGGAAPQVASPAEPRVEEPGAAVNPVSTPNPVDAAGDPVWVVDAEAELKKIPFFVRGKARRNTEQFARDRGIAKITLETLYDAKAYHGR
ncbi:MAG: ferredoxin:protochlorophyllide reductase (ATP-dependent) subunit B [Myxococcota bacterium]